MGKKWSPIISDYSGAVSVRKYASPFRILPYWLVVKNHHGVAASQGFSHLRSHANLQSVYPSRWYFHQTFAHLPEVAKISRFARPCVLNLLQHHIHQRRDKGMSRWSACCEGSLRGSGISARRQGGSSLLQAFAIHCTPLVWEWHLHMRSAMLLHSWRMPSKCRHDKERIEWSQLVFVEWYAVIEYVS